MNFKPGDKVTWDTRSPAPGRPPIRTGIFHHHINHNDFWAEEKALITDVDGNTDVKVYVAVDRLKKAP